MFALYESCGKQMKSKIFVCNVSLHFYSSVSSPSAPITTPPLDPCPIILIVESAIVNFILSLTVGQMEAFELCIHLCGYDSGWELSYR